MRRKFLKKKRQKFAEIVLALMPSLMVACASSQSRPTEPPFFAARPVVRPCQPPREPARLDTQGDLLTAYLDALSAWAACRLEVEKIRIFYTEIDNGTE